MPIRKKIIFFTIWIFICTIISFIIYKSGIYDPLSDIAEQAHFDITHQRENRVKRHLFIYLIYHIPLLWVIYITANLEVLRDDQEEFPEFDYSSYYFFYAIFIFLTCGFVFLFTATIILMAATLGLPKEISLAFFLKRIDGYFFLASIISIFIMFISFLFPKKEKY